MMTNASVLEKLEQWLDTIEADIVNLLHRRQIFREVQKIVVGNPRIQGPNVFYDWMASTYAASSVIGVRRQVDEDSRAISLLKLMREIRRSPEELTRERHLDRYREVNPEMEEAGDLEFDRFAGQGNPHIDPGGVQYDISELLKATEHLERYATKRVAHSDAEAPPIIPSFDDLDRALDLLERLLKKYRLLILVKGGDVVPTVIDAWKGIFMEPWIVPPYPGATLTDRTEASGTPAGPRREGRV
jgi:hypothetical protein